MSRFYKTTATPTVDYAFELPFDELFRAKEYKDKRHDAALEELQTGYDEVMQINYKPDDEDTVMGWRQSIADIYDKYSSMPDLSNAAGLIKRDIRNAIPTRDIQDVTWNYDRYVAEQQHIAKLKEENRYVPHLDQKIGTSGSTLPQYDADGNLIFAGTGREFPTTVGQDPTKLRNLAELHFNNMPEHERTTEGIHRKSLHGSKSWPTMYGNIAAHYGQKEAKNIDDLYTRANNGDSDAASTLQNMAYEVLYHTGMERWGYLADDKTSGKDGPKGESGEPIPNSDYNNIITNSATTNGTTLSGKQLGHMTNKTGVLDPDNNTRVVGSGSGPHSPGTGEIILSASHNGALPMFIPRTGSDIEWATLATGGNPWQLVEGADYDPHEAQQQAYQYNLLKKFYAENGTDADKLKDVANLRLIRDMILKMNVEDIKLGPEIFAQGFMLDILKEKTPEIWQEYASKNEDDELVIDQEKLRAATAREWTEDQRRAILQGIREQLVEQDDIIGKFVTGDISTEQRTALIELQNVGIWDPFSTESIGIYQANEKLFNEQGDMGALTKLFTQVLANDAFTGVSYDFEPRSGNNTFLTYVPGKDGEVGENMLLTYGNGYITESELDNVLQMIPEEERAQLGETIKENSEGFLWMDWKKSNSWMNKLVDNRVIRKTTVQGIDEPVYVLPMVLKTQVSTQNRMNYDQVSMSKLPTGKLHEYASYHDKTLLDNLTGISSENSADRQRDFRNNENRLLIDQYVGNNRNIGGITETYYDPEMIASRNLIFDRIVTNENTGINSQLDRIKSIDEEAYNNIMDYVGDEIKWMTEVHDRSTQKNISGFISNSYGGTNPQHIERFGADLEDKAGRVARLNALINPQFHNALARDYTDSELLAQVKSIVSDFSRLEYALDRSDTNKDIGIENGIVTDWNKLTTSTNDLAQKDGMIKFNPTKYKNLNIQTGEDERAVSGTWISPGAEPSLSALNAWAQKNNSPLTITSMFRLPAYNRIVGGHKHSDHLHGNAIDVSTKSGETLWRAYNRGELKGIVKFIKAEGDHYHVELVTRTYTGE